jgi:prepilin signal peptidase PulO-like enzyme (type II secretory pathway)
VTGDRLPPVEEAGQGCLAILLLLLLIGLGVGSILTYWYIFVPVVLVASTLLIVAFKRGMGPRV